MVGNFYCTDLRTFLTITSVLTNKNTDAVDKKGKDRDIAKWEAEVRKSVASKKASGAATPTLTKQQQALVKAQLDKEAEIRQRVVGLKANLERGLHIIHSLVAANAGEMGSYMSAISTVLLENAFGVGPTLVGDKIFEAYLVSLLSIVPHAIYIETIGTGSMLFISSGFNSSMDWHRHIAPFACEYHT
jgi:hypothetical protein